MRIGIGVVPFLAAVVTCSADLKATDPFFADSTPITSDIKTAPEAYKKGIGLLQKEGYMVLVERAWLKAVTSETDLNFLVWRETHEKWKVSVQFALRVFAGHDDTIYWELTHRISGSRAGKPDRRFDPQDFDETNRLVDRLALKIANVFSAETSITEHSETFAAVQANKKP